jgi:WD40 repeat protein
MDRADTEEFYDAVDHSAEQGTSSAHHSPAHTASVVEFSSDPPPLTLQHRRSLSAQHSVPEIEAPRRTVLRALTVGVPVKVTLTQTHNKGVKEFEGLALTQEITVNSEEDATIWVTKFSPSGQFLAVSGQNPTVLLYEVETEGEQLFKPMPYRAYLGHTRPIVDLSWSKSSTHFISASMDKTAILWQVESSSPILRFSHPDIVSAVTFNPYVPFTQNANYCLTGCFDKMVRVWNIPQDRVEACYQTPDLVTALSCSAETHLVIAGLRQGLCIVYEASVDVKLKFLSQVYCKNRKGRKAKGRKVTGIEFLDETQFLVTTNDSRVRLMNLQDFTMVQKYKGCKNEQAPIKATFSHNFSHVICGSDTGSVYLWNLHSSQVSRLE